MKKHFIPAIAVLSLVSCSSWKNSKYDFSNVESISLDAMHPSPKVVIADTTIIIAEHSQRDFSRYNSIKPDHIQKDTVNADLPLIKYDFNNVQSISNEGMHPAPKLCGEPVVLPEPTVPRQDPLHN